MKKKHFWKVVQVAQLEEQRIENPCVSGSNPLLSGRRVAIGEVAGSEPDFQIQVKEVEADFLKAVSYFSHS